MKSHLIRNENTRGSMARASTRLAEKPENDVPVANEVVSASCSPKSTSITSPMVLLTLEVQKTARGRCRTKDSDGTEMRGTCMATKSILLGNAFASRDLYVLSHSLLLLPRNRWAPEKPGVTISVV